MLEKPDRCFTHCISLNVDYLMTCMILSVSSCHVWWILKKNIMIFCLIQKVDGDIQPRISAHQNKKKRARSLFFSD